MNVPVLQEPLGSVFIKEGLCDLSLYTVQMYMLCQVMTCDSGWTLSTSTGRCYKMVTSRISWAGARAHCQGQGTNGDLASIPDQETNELVFSLLSGSGVYWLGGTDAASEGVWQWADGTPWGYTNWRSGQPNDIENTENHLAMVGSNGLWTDQPETKNIWFVCQY